MPRAIAAILLATALTASADPDTPTSADVAADPLPGYESGRVDATGDDESVPHQLARTVLAVPRTILEVVLTPLRLGVWAWSRYHLGDLYDRLFFNADRTIGLYPTVAFESGFGLSGIVAGARFVDRDVFGEHEHLALQAAAGTAYNFRQLYSASMTSGRRLGDRFTLELDLGYELRPRDAFYGIGNGDLTTTPPAMPVDPRTNSLALETHYSQTRARAVLAADTRVWDRLHVRAAGSLSDRSFGTGDFGIPTDMAYATSGLVGWGGVQDVYGELDVRWDSRTAGSIYEPTGMPATGTLVDAFAGRTHLFDDVGTDFWRYGVDVEHFFRIARGPRVLALRFHGEGVTGSVDDVPFSELPMLGGTFLRGYAPGRFRDRVAAYGTIEYQWDLSAGFAANVFTDIGRVYDSLDALTLHDLRAGYGLGLQYHGGGALAMETSIGASLEGDIFVSIAFNPVYDLDERVRRR